MNYKTAAKIYFFRKQGVLIFLFVNNLTFDIFVFLQLENCSFKNYKKMKKIIPILLVAVLALTGCQNKNQYAGTYSGTFTFFKFSTADISQGATSSDNKTGKMQFLTNPLTNGLLLYSVIPLNAVTPEQYVSNSGLLDYLDILLESIGYQNNIYNAATEQIKNVGVTVAFSGNTVHAELQYEIQILGTINTRITIVKFDGVR